MRRPASGVCFDTLVGFLTIHLDSFWLASTRLNTERDLCASQLEFEPGRQEEKAVRTRFRSLGPGLERAHEDAEHEHARQRSDRVYTSRGERT